MGMGKEVKTAMINFLLGKGIDLVNSKEEVRKTIKDSMHGENRTLLLKIKDFDTLGFGVVGDKIVKVSDVPKPTVTVTLSEDTFLLIVKGKLTFREAFFDADMDVFGENWLRDYITFNAIFEQFNQLSKELGL
jgi:putative sterol carrier protein